MPKGDGIGVLNPNTDSVPTGVNTNCDISAAWRYRRHGEDTLLSRRASEGGDEARNESDQNRPARHKRASCRIADRHLHWAWPRRPIRGPQSKMVAAKNLTVRISISFRQSKSPAETAKAADAFAIGTNMLLPVRLGAARVHRSRYPGPLGITAKSEYRRPFRQHGWGGGSRSANCFCCVHWLASHDRQDRFQPLDLLVRHREIIG